LRVGQYLFGVQNNQLISVTDGNQTVSMAPLNIPQVLLDRVPLSGSGSSAQKRKPTAKVAAPPAVTTPTAPIQVTPRISPVIPRPGAAHSSIVTSSLDPDQSYIPLTSKLGQAKLQHNLNALKQGQPITGDMNATDHTVVEFPNQ